jgi:hypothetical protein
LLAERRGRPPPDLVVGSERGEGTLVYWVVKGGAWLIVHILIEVINFILIRPSTISTLELCKLKTTIPR